MLKIDIVDGEFKKFPDKTNKEEQTLSKKKCYSFFSKVLPFLKLTF